MLALIYSFILYFHLQIKSTFTLPNFIASTIWFSQACNLANVASRSAISLHYLQPFTQELTMHHDSILRTPSLRSIVSHLSTFQYFFTNYITTQNYLIQNSHYQIQQYWVISQMLLPYLPVLNEKKIILGSQSKSRNELITTQKIKYERISSKFAEDLDKESFASPDLYNLETCKGKVKDLLQTFKKEDKQWDMLICGDTIVCDGNRIIEKPVDAEDCIKMMSSLANKTHHVYTAHCLLFNTEPMITYEWVGTAAVTFGDVPLECFKEYSKLDEPYIHSGGYELTAVSGSFLKEINGSHTLVQGLDIYQLCNKIIEGSRKAKWLE